MLGKHQVRYRYVYHPNFIWRIGGEPADLMHALSDRSSQDLLDRIDVLRESVTGLAVGACAILERLVPTLDDRMLRRQVLALRRDIFKARPPSCPPDPRILAPLAPTERSALSDVVERIVELTRLEDAFVATFDAELLLAELELPRLFERSNVSDGLRAVNPELHAALDTHYGLRRTRIGNKAERSLDTSFLQYFSRTALKTSPLSSFTPILVGRWRDDGATTVDVRLPELPLRRQASLRRSLLMEVLTPLLRTALLSEQSRLTLNNSLRKVGSQFIVNRRIEEPSLRSMTWGVGLEEVRFEATPALATIVGIFSRVEPPGVTLADFVRQIEGRVAPAQLNSLVKAVHALLKLGVLQSSSQFVEQEDPILHALSVLGETEPTNGSVGGLLIQVRDDLDNYVAEASAAERAAVARRIGSRLREAAAAAQKELSADIVSPFLYEDCQVAIDDFALSERALDDIACDLQRLVSISPLFDMNASLQCWLASNFLDQFGPDGVCGDPRAFLLSQMKEIDGGVIAPWTISSIGKDSGFGAELKRLKDDFFDHIAQRIGTDGRAAIDQSFVERLAGAIPEPVARRPKSHCFFGQFFTDADGTRGFALNQILSGSSQLFARFLEGGPAHATRVAAYLRKTSRFGHFLELAGVFGFNANLYPALGDDELVIPPYSANRREGRKHELDRLSLRYDATTHRVYLSDTDGRPADIYYLGLLNPGLIPQLHRIVCGLSTQAPIFFSELSRAMKRHGINASGPSFSTPRVTLGRIVLLRRAWNVASSSLPQLRKLDQAEAFRAIHQWRKEHGLPSRAFIRFSPSEGQLRVAGTDQSDFDWANFDRTKLKPFYVDFSNPLLARQFVKARNASSFDATLQEPLPDIGDQNLTVAGRGHVAELQLELSAVSEA